MRKLAEALFCVCGLLFAVWLLAAYGHIRLPHVTLSDGAPRVLSFEEWESHCRQVFQRDHPGEKPINWRIARSAERFHHEQPMGKFVLHKNDCSDFVEALVDDALGAKARLDRDSNRHLAMRGRGLFYAFDWRPDVVMLPGDVVQVAHSPWYPPSPSSMLGHIGAVGTDGKVYDFTKLRSWKSARYGRTALDFFVHNCSQPGEVVIWRLMPEYRYRVRPLPWPIPQATD